MNFIMHTFQASLPYTQAVLMESMRMSTLVPSVAHFALEDVHVRGYVIPKVIFSYKRHDDFISNLKRRYLFSFAQSEIKQPTRCRFCHARPNFYFDSGNYSFFRVPSFLQISCMSTMTLKIG